MIYRTASDNLFNIREVISEKLTYELCKDSLVMADYQRIVRNYYEEQQREEQEQEQTQQEQEQQEQQVQQVQYSKNTEISPETWMKYLKEYVNESRYLQSLFDLLSFYMKCCFYYLSQRVAIRYK